jgi:hypothetical protein
LLSKDIHVKIHRTIILLGVLYGREIWSLPLGEEHRLMVFETKVLRKVLAPKRDEMIGDWAKFYYEELHDLYSSPNIIWDIRSKRMGWVGHGAHMGNAYRV